MNVVYFFLFHLLIFSSLIGENLSQRISQIPLEDILQMRAFADRQFVWDQAMYPLFFNDKSCSLSGIPIRTNDDSYYSSILIKEWEIFKKYENQFRHKNFILSLSPSRFGNMLLLIINKRALKKCISQHKDVFKSVIGKQFSYRWLIDELENEKPILNVIKDSDLLLGILLGYGIESSQLFEYYCNHPGSRQLLKPAFSSRISSEVSSVDECFSVAFVGNLYSQETRALRSLYRNQLSQFLEHFRKKDPLILFLEGYSQKESDILPGLEKSNWEQKITFPKYILFYMSIIKGL